MNDTLAVILAVTCFAAVVILSSKDRRQNLTDWFKDKTKDI